MAQKFIVYNGTIVSDDNTLKLFVQNVSSNNTLAGSPSIDSISGGSEQALIYYTTGTTGTNPIIDYEYSIDGGNTWISIGSTDNPLIITGLINGVNYDIEIRPITIDGAGSESNVVSVTPQGIPWLPDNISVVAWIDASDSSNYTRSGTSLLSVTDKAGVYSNMTIGGNPTTNSATKNGLNVFDFDGNDYLQGSSYEQQVNSGNHWAIGVFYADFVNQDKDSFWSYDTNQNPKRDYAISSAGGGSNTWPGELDLDGLSSNRISTTIGNRQTWNLQSVSIDSWVIVSCWFNKTGNQIGCRINGSNAFNPVNDYDNSLKNNQKLRLMRNRTSRELDGRLAEFFAVADIPGTGGTDLTNLEKAEGYMAWKWGLESDLPSSHPYKNSAPTV
tara:strand:+ start:1113 stop:2273 length:1161 start_codon:yes stop_codon:yes gene_type:complete